MSEHDVAAKCARQVADLQAKLTELRVLYADRDGDLTHEYQRAEAAEAEARELSAENARLLTGLRAAKLFAATQSAKVGNGFMARGEWHKLAEQLQAVIDGPAYVPPDVIYEAALEVRAGTPLGLDPLKVLEVE